MQDVLEIMKKSGAFLEGHFLLSSGRHSNKYCQCAQLLKRPDYAEQALCGVVAQVKSLGVVSVCGPAMGGILVSYELARQLKVDSIFTERVEGEMQLRRGFTVSPGDRVLIAEDVVTTGKSTMETVRALEEFGAEVVGVACIVDRRAADCVLKLPVFAALALTIESWEQEACPLCKQGAALVKPGSRNHKIS